MTRDQRLIRHFLSQFVENDLSPDADRHQVLAIAAAALITVPLFVTVFMSVKYLMRPLQAAGWTETTMMGDAVAYCATSMLVAAIVAVLEWDALALSPRDAAILGVLPIPHRTVVRAKVTALLMFAGGFVLALNALPAVLHPLLMTAQLPMSPFKLLPLMAAHALSATMAGALGFGVVLAIREVMSFGLGPYWFARASSVARSALLFSFLTLLALVPLRLSDSGAWMFEARTPALLAPVSWFAATHAAIAGRVLDPLPRRALPKRMEAEETQLTLRYERELPRLTQVAVRGALALGGTAVLALALYLWNARRMYLMPETFPRTASVPHAARRVRRALSSGGATRTGFMFFVRVLTRSPVHRVSMIVGTVAGVTLFVAMGPGPVATSTLAAQTLLVAALVAGARTAIRTAADYRAMWLFDIADTGSMRRFRNGVRLGLMLLAVTPIVALLAFHAATWGLDLASAHAVNGIAMGWVLVEMALSEVDRPLVASIPPPDGINTVGVVLLGSAVLAAFLAAHIEEATIGSTAGRVCFPLTFAAVALWICLSSQRMPIEEARAAASALPTE